jgi:hypothetical protein
LNVLACGCFPGECAGHRECPRCAGELDEATGVPSGYWGRCTVYAVCHECGLSIPASTDRVL